MSARTIEETPTNTEKSTLSGPNVASFSLSVPSGGLSSSTQDATQSWIPFTIDPPQVTGTVLPDDSFFLDDSLFSFGDALTPSFGP